jgi:hypothetical protein
MAILALLHERFPVMDAYDVLKHSKTPAFSFVYGTFGTNPNNYYKLMDQLLAKDLPNGLVVEIYMTCGPCRPPRTKGNYVKRFSPGKSISKLRKALEKKNRTVLKRYKQWNKPIIKNFIDPYIDDPRVRFVIVPELEDNQSVKSFKRLLKVNRRQLKSYPRVKYVRNHVGDLFNSAGLKKELHNLNKHILTLMWSGDIISMDGEFWTFPEEEAVGKRLPFNYGEVRRFVKAAKKKGVHIYLWRPEWQGLIKERGKKLHPRDRTYRIQNKSRLIQLIKIK